MNALPRNEKFLAELPDQGKKALLGEERERELSTLCKALGHPIRVRILRLLLARERCLCADLFEALPLAQSTISQHLKVLCDAGLIKPESAKSRHCYCVDPQALDRLRSLLEEL